MMQRRPPTPRSLARDAAGARVGVVVVDDQLVFRQVAHEVIDATHDFELLGEAASGPHALLAVSELHPDLVLLDVRMPGMDGIETARRLHAEHPATVVVLITVGQSPNLPGGISSCGAVGLVNKQDFGPGMLRRLWAKHGPATARQAL
jgi:two-component system invasion response regulator UvrY